MLRLDPNENLEFDEQDCIFLNSTLRKPKTIIEIPTKAYVASLSDNDRNRRHSSTVFNDQENEFHNNKLTDLDSITIDRNPLLDDEVSNKKYVDDELDKFTTLRFNQTLQNYLRVSVGNDVYNLTKFDKKQITDTTNFKFPKQGGYLL